MKRPKSLQPSEHKLQVALFDFWAVAGKPGIEMRAIPNGEKRHIRVATRLKAEGVRRGTPDIFVCLPEGKVAWLEMKTKSGSLSPEQKQFRDAVTALGHRWAMARTLDEAIEHLGKWGVLRDARPIFSTEHLSKIQLKQTEGVNHGT